MAREAYALRASHDFLIGCAQRSGTRDDIKISESTDGVDEEDGEDGETGEDEEGNLEVLLNLTTDVDGVEIALLETGGTVFMMVVVMMMMFGHYLYFILFIVYCLLFIDDYLDRLRFTVYR